MFLPVLHGRTVTGYPGACGALPHLAFERAARCFLAAAEKRSNLEPDSFYTGIAGDKDVAIGGGASTIQQALKEGLLDEIQIHLVPILLGDGIRLFEHLGAKPLELQRTRVVDSPAVTHLRYRVL